jgi:hypothetical protein
LSNSTFMEVKPFPFLDGAGEGYNARRSIVVKTPALAGVGRF